MPHMLKKEEMLKKKYYFSLFLYWNMGENKMFTMMLKMFNFVEFTK